MLFLLLLHHEKVTYFLFISFPNYIFLTLRWTYFPRIYKNSRSSQPVLLCQGVAHIGINSYWQLYGQLYSSYGVYHPVFLVLWTPYNQWVVGGHNMVSVEEYRALLYGWINGGGNTSDAILWKYSLEAYFFFLFLTYFYCHFSHRERKYNILGSNIIYKGTKRHYSYI